MWVRWVVGVIVSVSEARCGMWMWIRAVGAAISERVMMGDRGGEGE